MQRYKRRQGGRWLNTPLVWLFVSLDWKFGGRGRGGLTHYKGVSKLKPHLLSFLYLFLLSKAPWGCGRSLRISQHLSWEWSRDARLALPAPNTHTPHPSFLCFHPAPLHRDFSRCTAKLPISTCMIIAHSDLYSGESSSTSFGRRKASALASFMPHYKNGMKSEWSCCLSALKLFAAEL